MSLEDIIAGDYGQTIQLTVLDVDTNAAADLSGYTTSQLIILRDPDGNEASKTAAFTTDGSDGVVEYTLVEDDIDEEGNWRARVQVTSATAKLTSLWSPFTVLEE